MTKKELIEEIAKGLAWRPVKFTRNKDYPKVVAQGCSWKQDGGGFSLHHLESNKYLGYYTKSEITALEKRYARKRP
jgi:hypothetical protein